MEVIDMSKKKLLASASNKENLSKLIKEFYGGSEKILNDDGTVQNKDGKVLSTKWEILKGRYRFYMLKV
jgi:hypothetical protein